MIHSTLCLLLYQLLEAMLLCKIDMDFAVEALPIFIHKTDSGSALMTEMRMFSDRSGIDFACWCLLLGGGVFVCC